MEKAKHDIKAKRFFLRFWRTKGNAGITSTFLYSPSFAPRRILPPPAIRQRRRGRGLGPVADVPGP